LPAVVQGPAWSHPGLEVVSARYPLRVETHVLRLVARLLPGVITTTPHARAYALHGLVWSEAKRRGLDFDAAFELLRRCEVVVAGVALCHRQQRAAAELDRDQQQQQDRREVPRRRRHLFPLRVRG
jgi:hypothetical protein